jgi:uncharacterized protein (TIGR02588 family)
LTVAIVQVQERAGSFVVDVEVRNQGRGAAADIQIAGSPGPGGAPQFQAHARLDYVPGFSVRRASLIFDADPGRSPVVRILGYAPP